MKQNKSFKKEQKKIEKSYNQMIKARAKALGVPNKAYELMHTARYNKIVQDAIKKTSQN